MSFRCLVWHAYSHYTSSCQYAAGRVHLGTCVHIILILVPGTCVPYPLVYRCPAQVLPYLVLVKVYGCSMRVLVP